MSETEKGSCTAEDFGEEITVGNGSMESNRRSPRDGGCSFEQQFKTFSKFGDKSSDGKQITLTQSDKWMKQAKVIDGKKITTTDTGICFKKLKSLKVGISDYKKFLDELATTKKLELGEVKTKMANCGQPGLHGCTGIANVPNAVKRLTDTSKYTGTQRQPAFSGKTKGSPKKESSY